MKGQSQLIGVMLLTLILITMVGVTYMWGMPLIEKQKSAVQISNAEKLMKELDKKIQNVVKNGGTEKIENVEIPGTLRLIDDDINDMFVLKLETMGSDIATGKEIYLKGSAQKETYVGDEPGVLKVLSKEMGNRKYEVTMTLQYRNVTGSESIYIIDIFGLGRDIISGDNHNIIISEGEGQKGPVGEENGKSIYITKVNVRFE